MMHSLRPYNMFKFVHTKTVGGSLNLIKRKHFVEIERKQDI